MKKIVKDTRGFTLIELLVAVAVLAILSSFLIVSYTSTLEDQRQQADFKRLEQIDLSLKQIYLYDDAFEEAKEHIHDNNKLTFTFAVTNSDGNASIDVRNAKINGKAITEDDFQKIYSYLIEYIDEPIQLESSTLKYGYYQVLVEFNYTQWGNSQVRVPTVNNDSIHTSNSGYEYFRQHNNS